MLGFGHRPMANGHHLACDAYQRFYYDTPFFQPPFTTAPSHHNHNDLIARASEYNKKWHRLQM
jgi:hypothetical protein